MYAVHEKRDLQDADALVLALRLHTLAACINVWPHVSGRSLIVLQSPPVFKIWHVQDLGLQQPALSAALLQHLQGCTLQEWDSRQIAGGSGAL